MNMIAGLLHVEDVLRDVEVSNKLELLDTIGRYMEQQHGLRREWVTQALARREQVGSTGLGLGFAIPHARILDLNRIEIAYLRLKSPIAFDSPDGKPVFEVLVLLVPKRATEEHLRILAEASQMFSDRSFRQRLAECSDAAAIKRQFNAWPQPAPACQGNDEKPCAPVNTSPRRYLFQRTWPFLLCR